MSDPFDRDRGRGRRGKRGRRRVSFLEIVLSPSLFSLPRVRPMKGVFTTPDTGPYFPSDTDIQTKISVSRHRHSELSARHSTSLQPDILISKCPTSAWKSVGFLQKADRYPSWRRTFPKISESTPDTQALDPASSDLLCQCLIDIFIDRVAFAEQRDNRFDSISAPPSVCLSVLFWLNFVCSIHIQDYYGDRDDYSRRDDRSSPASQSSMKTPVILAKPHREEVSIYW